VFAGSLAACAQVGTSNNGGGGGLDLSVEPPDLYGVDLYGADLTTPIDFAGVDLFGVDLRSPCTVLPQAGCNPGEKCTLASMDDTLCVSNGNKKVGEACGPGSDDCEAGNLCVTDQTLLLCRQFCAFDQDCKQPAVAATNNIPHCLVTLGNSTQKTCTVPCNPVLATRSTTPSGCAAGFNCEVFRTMTIDQATDCSKGGTGTDGANCATNGNGDCADGYTCVVNQAMERRCRAVCRVQGGAGTSADCAVAGGGYICAVPSMTTNPAFGFCCPGTGC
jgi:hypothetical protein